jgi:capsular polysaccharide transport system permease protein
MINAFAVQKRVISALILREIHTRYGNRQFGYLWEIVEHIAHILLLSVIFSLLQRATPVGDSFGVFFATGLIPFLLFSHIDKQIMNAVNGNQALLSYPMVMPFDLIIARTILECATTGVVIVLFLAAGFYFKLLAPVDSVLDLFMAFATVIVIGMGLGMINSAIILYVETYKSIYPFFMRPLYFISGIFYTADSLPREAQQALFFNPLLHVNEWVRSAFFISYESHFVDKFYVVSVGVVLLFLGLLLENLTKEKVRQIC